MLILRIFDDQCWDELIWMDFAMIYVDQYRVGMLENNVFIPGEGGEVWHRGWQGSSSPSTLDFNSALSPI